MVCDGEWVAILSTAQLELAFEVGAPQRIGRSSSGEGRPLGALLAPTQAFDQAVSVQHGMDSASGRHAQIAQQPLDQQFSDVAGTLDV